MAIERLVRARDKLTPTGFTNAKSLDEEFDVLHKYLDNVIIPNLKNIFNFQVLASEKPQDYNKFLYEDKDGGLAWGTPSDLKPILTNLKPPLVDLAIIIQKKDATNITFAPVDNSTGTVLVFDANNKPRTTTVLPPNDSLTDANFNDDTIGAEALTDFCDVRFSSVSVRNIEDHSGWLVQPSLPYNVINNFNLDIYHPRVYNYPVRTFGKANCKIRIQDEAAVTVYWGDLISFAQESSYFTNSHNANIYNWYYFNPVYLMPQIQINQTYDIVDDYIDSDQIAGKQFDVLWLTMHRDLKFRANIDATAFEDGSIGVRGAMYASNPYRTVYIIPKTAKDQRDVVIQNEMFDFTDANITMDLIADDIIDEYFLPPKVRAKIV
jgi:hypothetical protein